MKRAGRLRLDGRFTDFACKMLVLASRTLEAMQYFGAKLLDLGIVREQTCDGLWSVSFLAGVGVDWLRRQDDMEVALAVRRRLCGGGRGEAGYVWTVYEMACFLFHVQWTSSCDHAATSSAVLHRISLTSGWCLSFSSTTEFFLVVNRDRYPQLWFLSLGFGCCSTLTWSMCLGTRLVYGGL